MIEITSNIGEVVLNLQQKIETLKNPDGLLRTVAQAVLPEMRKRVHVEGKDSNGSQIGTYSNAYMRVRLGHNRGGGRQKILSLTSQMENDMSVVATETGYGIGYLNPFNLKKALWNEEREKKKILTALAQGEIDLVAKVADEYIEETLK